MRRFSGRTLVAVAVAATLALPACSADAPVAAPLEERVAAVVEEQLAVDPSFEAIRAVVVSVDGETIFEDYPESSANEYHPTNSVTKSVVGTLIGIAIDEGLIAGLDEPLSVLLPDYSHRMSRTVGAATLREVLTMTAGMAENWSSDDFSFMEAADPVAAILRSPVGPGQEFAYSDQGAHVLSAVLAEATGMSVLDYAREKLFAPLGVDTEPSLEPAFADENLDAYLSAGFAWPVDAQDVHVGWGLLKLRPGDMTKIGQLYLDQGRWQDQQLLSAGWVAEATTAQVPAEGALNSYGFQWWVGEVQGHSKFLAWGFGGQAIQVVPDLGLVTVAATELDWSDSNSQGVGPSIMIFILDQIAAEVAN